MAPQTKLLTTAFIVIAAITGISASVLWRHATIEVELANGTMLSPARALPDFSLIDHHRRTFTAADLRGSWTLMFFGYTQCPDFCPTTLTVLAAWQKRLRAAAAPVLPRVIFMSVDAKRDTPEQLARYVPYFDPAFIGITASDQPAIEAVAAKLGVAVTVSEKSDGSYSVDHSGSIFVVNPDGKLAAILSGPFTVDGLQADFTRIMAAEA